MSFKTTVNLLADGACKPVNCRICGGELYPALSPKNLNGKAPEGIIFAAHSEGVKDFFACTDTELYTSTRGNYFERIGSLAGDKPFMIEDVYEGKPRAVVINGGGALYNSGGRYDVIFAYGARLGCGVMHCGRLFGADLDDGYKLRWSGEGGLTDWEEGLYGSGSLTLDPARGEVLDIVEFGEKLIAVRKLGLTVLSMFGSPENFSAEITDTDADEIYKGTARAAGGKLIFCTASGLRSFDGSVIKKLPHALSGDISNPVCSAVLNGKYYLSCRSKILNGGAVLCYDTADGGSYLIDFAADALCSADKIYAYNKDGAFALEAGGVYVMTSGRIDFGSGRRKTVTEIFIEGEADVEISNGRTARKFTDARGLIRPRLRGESFTVKITGTKAVKKLNVTAEECDAI